MDLELVYVEWVDAVADPENGWKDIDGSEDFFSREDNIVRQTGFIFMETDEYIGLVSGYMPSDEMPIYSMRIKIPTKWILRREAIKIDYKTSDKDI